MSDNPQDTAPADQTQEEEVEQLDESLYSDVDPQSLTLEPRVRSSLRKMNFTKLTKIQAESFQPIIDKKDVLIRADTGSGKTVSYLLPILQRLNTDFNRITRDLGPLAIIVAPTRELCQQIETVVLKFKSQMPYIVPGTLVGGDKVQSEKKRIRKGITVLIATPGRLLYHLQNSSNLTLNNLQFLVLDEADRLLDMGFLNTLEQIIQYLPPRQTILVSATLHQQLSQLQQIAMKDPVFVGAMKDEEFSIPDTLVQRYIVVEDKWRLVMLAGLLRHMIERYEDMKAIVFINSCLSVDFHYAFFNHFKYTTPGERRISKSDDPQYHKPTIRDPHAGVDDDETGAYCPYLHCPIFRIHGNIDQIDRSKSMSKFTAAQNAVLFCTDVAARGLDIPDVTTIVQYDPPIDTEDYVHRVGRTARIGRDGIAFMFLQPFEAEFASLLDSKGVKIKETSFDNMRHRAVSAMYGDDDELCFAAMRKETISTVNDNELENIAAKGWSSAIAAYTSHRKETRHIFAKYKLHLGHMALAFALEKSPTEIKEMLAEERDLMRKQKKSEEKPEMMPAIENRTSEFL